MQIDRAETGAAALLEELLGAPVEESTGTSFEAALEALLMAAEEIPLPPEGAPLPQEIPGSDLGALVAELAAETGESSEGDGAPDIANRLLAASVDPRGGAATTPGGEPSSAGAAAAPTVTARVASPEAQPSPAEVVPVTAPVSPEAAAVDAPRPETVVAAAAVAGRGARPLSEGVTRTHAPEPSESAATNRVVGADGAGASVSSATAPLAGPASAASVPGAAAQIAGPQESTAAEVANARVGVAEEREADPRAQVAERPAPEPVAPVEAARPIAPPVNIASTNGTPVVAAGGIDVTPDLRAPSAAGPPQPIEALPHHIELLTTQGGGTARVRLHPAELGEVEITVRLRGNKVEVVIQADEPAARMAVMANREQLVDAMGSRELRVDSLEVAGRREEDSAMNDGSPREAFDQGFENDRRGEGDSRGSNGVAAASTDTPEPGRSAGAGQPGTGIDIRI